MAVRIVLHSGIALPFPGPVIYQLECYGQHAHDLADAAALGQVRVLEPVAALLRVAEEGFDVPAHPMDPERLRALEIMTDYRQASVTAVADPLGGEIDLATEHLVQIARQATGRPTPLRMTLSTRMLMWVLPNWELVRSRHEASPAAGFVAIASTSAPTRRAGSAQAAKKRWKRR